MEPARPRGRWSWWVAAAAAAISIVASSCGGGTGGATGTGQTATGPPQRGGSLTYLASGALASWDLGLDPASAGFAPSTYEDAIFGQLFRLGAKGDPEPQLAAGAQLSDGGKTLTISLRTGVKFTDGTPLDAAAVAWNFNRDLQDPCTCSPRASWPKLAPEGVTTPDDHTVAVHFSKANAAVVQGLIASSANHIASPTSVQKMGDQFKLKPVGAGPFQVESNLVSSQLVLTRNPNYSKKGQPYLDRLVVKTVGGDQPAYQAILAGQAQATAITTPTLIQQASQNGAVSVTRQTSTAPYAVQLNTATAPFNDQRAREAIYYATDPSAINSHVFGGMFSVTQSFTTPGSPFYMPKVSGYRTHDVAKAKQLVSQLGGLKVDVIGGADTVANLALQSLQSQWAEAGIQTTIHPYPDLTRIIQDFTGKKWQAALQFVGSVDPALATGLPFRMLSNAVYSGINDPALDQLMDQAATSADKSTRTQLYQQIAKYISDHAYLPFLFGGVTSGLAARGANVPGLTTKVVLGGGFLAPSWDEAWVGKG
ncbi:MAG: ABC transporter substrate-binding protein [bacterium]|nr:ABC transporter substrate-binding protein [bacterium]